MTALNATLDAVLNARVAGDDVDLGEVVALLQVARADVPGDALDDVGVFLAAVVAASGVAL